MDDRPSETHGPRRPTGGRLLAFHPSRRHRTTEPSGLRQRLDELVNSRQDPRADGPHLDPRLSRNPLLTE